LGPVLLNDLLAEVAAFSQLLFHFLVISEIPLESFNHGGHLVVLVHKVLRLLRLVLELASELRVLDHRQFGGADELLFI
jgi:hypothetical protein